jgi:hypothetical protein
MAEMTREQVLLLGELTGHPGWALYVEILRRQLHEEVEELVGMDGDARAQLARQMKCRAFKARIRFEEELEAVIDHLQKEEEDSPIPLSRLLAAGMREER